MNGEDEGSREGGPSRGQELEKNPIGRGDGQQVEDQAGYMVAGGRRPVETVVDRPNQGVDRPVVVVEHLLLRDAAEHLCQPGEIQGPIVVAELDDVAVVVHQIQSAREHAGAGVEQRRGGQQDHQPHVLSKKRSRAGRRGHLDHLLGHHLSVRLEADLERFTPKLATGVACGHRRAMD